MTPTTDPALMPFFTLAGTALNGVDHISSFRLSVGKKTDLTLNFTRDPMKAMKFEDRPAAERTLETLRMFMRSAMRQYSVVETPAPKAVTP